MMMAVCFVCIVVVFYFYATFIFFLLSFFSLSLGGGKKKKKKKNNQKTAPAISGRRFLLPSTTLSAHAICVNGREEEKEEEKGLWKKSAYHSTLCKRDSRCKQQHTKKFSFSCCVNVQNAFCSSCSFSPSLLLSPRTSTAHMCMAHVDARGTWEKGVREEHARGVPWRRDATRRNATSNALRAAGIEANSTTRGWIRAGEIRRN